MSLYQIGCNLVNCSRVCSAVHRNPTAGVIPRCLILESPNGVCSAERMRVQNNTGTCGCAIVGLNPGNSDGKLGQKERDFYVNNECSYQSVIDWFNSAGGTHVYYRRMRELVLGLGFDGDVLWTELAKCENDPLHMGALPVQTYRTCVGEYLKKEIALLPAAWPIFAVGRESFKALAYIFSDRAVIGVPHPTGSRGYFHSLFNGNGICRTRVAVKVINDVNAAVNGRHAVWLEVY